MKRSVNCFKFRDEHRVISNVQDIGYTHGCRNLKNEQRKTESRMEKIANESRPRIFAYDDVSGAPLEVDLVKKAREEEIKYFKKMGVYKK
eukprot:12408905-Karenia_brevis.AAC.1